MNEEPIAKVSRIRELADMGLNTPRMLFVPHRGFDSSEVNEFLKKADQGFVNIRTYKRLGKKESWASTHVTFLDLELVFGRLAELIYDGYDCMVDLENPSDGIMAGSIHLMTGWNFGVDYCHMPNGGAVVRMTDDPRHNIRASGNYRFWVDQHTVPKELVRVLGLAFTKFDMPYKSVILEFSYHRNPCGVLGTNHIFWEYRNLEEF